MTHVSCRGFRGCLESLLPSAEDIHVIQAEDVREEAPQCQQDDASRPMGSSLF